MLQEWFITASLPNIDLGTNSETGTFLIMTYDRGFKISIAY